MEIVLEQGKESVTIKEKKIRYTGLLILHSLPIIAILQGTSSADWILFFCLWPVHAFSATVGLHRYFAHKSFKTSRAFQFVMALCSACTLGDPIGFAGKHRIHHKYSDEKEDVHSPNQGIWHCWLGSLVDNGYSEKEILWHAKDLCRFPELVWLHEHRRIPGIVFASILFLVGGFSAVAIGFALGVVSIIHLGSLVNYCCHKFGNRRFETGDKSTNSFIVAVFAVGEGWHNNHHYYPSSARAGFYWWEIDASYYVICLFEKLGLVWNVKRPPQRVYESGKTALGLET